MADLDLIVRGGTVVTPAELIRADLGIAAGQIVAVAPEISDPGREVIDATGLHVFPGVIDAHVHFNEPGRAHWEGFVTGSRALAAGGATTFFDMPLNSSPPTLDAASFEAKLASAQAGSLVDFALWGGLVPQNLDRLEELHERGVIGFKAFMANSGIEDFPWVDDAALRRGMKHAAKLGGIVAVHAESEATTHQLTQERVAKGLTSVRDFLEARPIIAELEAIRRAIDLAGEAQCALHIVHVSCGEGVALVADAQRQGADVSCETCPHYLVLTERDVEQLGAVAKCAPPLRPASVQAELWQHLLAGRVTTIGSDHSPSPPEMKKPGSTSGADFFKLWGGIAGGQHTLELLLTRFPQHALPMNPSPSSPPSPPLEGKVPEGRLRGIPSGSTARFTTIESGNLSLLSQLTAFNVAKRFCLQPAKGAIAVGADADLAMVDLRREALIRREDLLDRHRLSPYVGRTLKARVVRTVLRGRTVAVDGRIVSQPAGRLVKPSSK